MSGHRVELRVRFTADDREAAEGVVQRLGHLDDSGEFSEYTGSFEVTRSTVDGVSWDKKWPQKCQAWLDLATAAAPGSVDDEPGYRIACDITPGEKHPIVRDPTAQTEWTRVHRAGSVWWADGNVPKDAEDDDA